MQLTAEIKATIREALELYRRKHSYYGPSTAAGMTLEQMRAKYLAARTTLTWLDTLAAGEVDAPQPTTQEDDNG